MGCKCGARTYEEHLRRCAAGYAGHAYRGFPPWRPVAHPAKRRADADS